MAKLTIQYETEVCSRCHGSGHYSRCQTWRTHCFKCGTEDKPGTGKQLTRRAKSAREKVETLKREMTGIPIEDLRAGMVYRDHVTGRNARVLSVTERRDLTWTTKVGDVESSGWSFVVETRGQFQQIANGGTVYLALTVEQMEQVRAYALGFKGVVEATIEGAADAAPEEEEVA